MYQPQMRARALSADVPWVLGQRASLRLINNVINHDGTMGSAVTTYRALSHMLRAGWPRSGANSHITLTARLRGDDTWGSKWNGRVWSARARPAARERPGSGLGDAKRAASFFQPSVARDSCRRSAGADDDKLDRKLPQQGAAEATAALRCAASVPIQGVTRSWSRLLPGTAGRYTIHDTPPFFGFVGAVAV